MLVGAILFLVVAFAVECSPPITGCLEGCLECATEATTCTKCDKEHATNKYLKDGACVTAEECTGSNDHYTDSSNPESLACKACSTKPGCKECGADGTCTKCNPNDPSNKKYLKDGACVTAEECTGSNDHYTDSSNPESLACKACSTKPGCKECGADGTCTKCNPNDPSNKKYLKDGACVTAEECTGSNDHYTDSSNPESLACKACSTKPGCKECGADGTCTKCNPNDPSNKKYLKDGACVTAEECTGSNDHYTDSSNPESLACKACSTKPGCKECGADGTCTKCNPNDPSNKKYLKDGACVTAEECTGSNDHYTDSSNPESLACKACSTKPGCKECGADGTCTKCNPNDPSNKKYLKDGACVTAEECTGSNDHYTDSSNPESLACKACSTKPGCKECGADGTCTKCNPNDPSNKKYLKDGACVTAEECTGSNDHYTDSSNPESLACKACSTKPGCKECGADGTCTKCNPNDPSNKKYLKDGACVTAEECTGSNDHYTDSSNPESLACKACSTKPGCKECGADGTCTKCNPNDPSNKKYLKDGACVTAEECTGSNDHYTDSSNPESLACKACSTKPGCKECGADGTCTKCNPNDPSNKKYLKDGACVTAEECTGSNDHYTDSSNPESLACKACSTKPGCKECGADGTCTKCNPNDPSNKKYLKDGACVTAEECTGSNDHYTDSSNPESLACKACSTKPGCKECGADGTCTKCNPNDPSNKKYLKDGACVTAEECTGSNDHYTDSSNPESLACKACSTKPGCKECGADGTCTKCNPNDPSNKKYLKDGACVTAEECTGSNDHYTDSSNPESLACKTCGENKRPNIAGDKCFLCPDPNCERCSQENTCARCSTGDVQSGGTCPATEPGCHVTCADHACAEGSMTNEANKCTSCKNSAHYLKPSSPANTFGTCVTVEECQTEKTHFAKDVTQTPGSQKKMCLPCGDTVHGVENCQTCDPLSSPSVADTKPTCKTCIDGTRPGDNSCSAASSPCIDPNCESCEGDKNICLACRVGYLTPASTCIEDCVTIDGYYNGPNKKCAKCDPNCKTCLRTDSAKCTSCPATKMLDYSVSNNEYGTCVDECKPKGGAGGCETCGATIGGTKYCSKCSTSAEVPINGVCTADNARAVVCVTKDGNGGCTKCKDGYFLQNNGCYELGRQPGEQVCTVAGNDGQCQTCANGLEAQAGDCLRSACHPTCKMCSAADASTACTMCAAGYYKIRLDAGACTSCEADSGSVKGVSGCLNCAPPSTGSGSVLCYLTKDDGTGGSTNRSGLSTGAIAGIAVAVVIVVGGLVGFLCWWFICRGKA